MKSKYDDRDTVGGIYLKAQTDSCEGLVVQDIGTEMAQSLVDDLNDTIASDPFEGRPFFVSVVEERDLQMKNAIKRRMFKTVYRPYPEDNTLVFYVDPKTGKVCFCWDVPHHSEMFNVLSNFTQYDHKYIRMIREWQNNNLTNFGFEKTMDGEHWIPNPNFIDRPHDEVESKVSLIGI
tara:strand:+ start:152 stop:685 length:534 start_codon:yes stop_codon:yes gene_type:complete